MNGKTERNLMSSVAFSYAFLKTAFLSKMPEIPRVAIKRILEVRISRD